MTKLHWIVDDVTLGVQLGSSHHSSEILILPALLLCAGHPGYMATATTAHHGRQSVSEFGESHLKNEVGSAGHSPLDIKNVKPAYHNIIASSSASRCENTCEITSHLRLLYLL